MKKILFIPWTATSGGGSEKILANITRNLSKDYEIDILQVMKYKNHIENFGDNVNLLYPVLDKINKKRIPYLISRIFFEIAPMLMKKMRVKKKYDYEIAFNYLYPAYLMDKKVKSIAYNHGSIENLLDEKEKKNREKYRKSLKYVNKIVAISKKTRESIEEVYPEYKDKIVTIYNGYDFLTMREKAKENINFEEDSLLFIGRLEEAKGVKRLANIYLSLIKRGLDKKIYFIGEGELENWLKNFIKKHCLSEKMFILGYKKNPYPYIKKASFVTLTSEAEGFPTVFVEGLALGVGFVSTKVGGSRELSNEGKCGFVSESDKKIENYLFSELLLPREKRKIQKEVCLDFVKKYSIEEQIKKIKELLKEIDND